jgi:hypothetical protein
LLAATLTLLSSRGARADDSVFNLMVQRLKENDKNDVTIRTGAALGLGASNNDRAGEPLCGALSNDSNEVVRQAAAVALKRLNRTSTLPCLRSREPVERDDPTKIAITRAIEAISAGGEGGGSQEPIKDNPNAKYYISLSSVANQTGRAQSEIEKIVIKSIRDKLDAAGIVQLAPSSESADKAREVMKKRALKGFYLAIAVEAFKYEDGALRVKVKLGVCRYPDKNLLGNVDKSLTAPGITQKDSSAEDRLLELAAGLASEQFAQNASAFL